MMEFIIFIYRLNLSSEKECKGIRLKRRLAVMFFIILISASEKLDSNLVLIFSWYRIYTGLIDLFIRLKLIGVSFLYVYLVRNFFYQIQNLSTWIPSENFFS